MVFSSLIFLWIFLPVVFILYFTAKEQYRNVILLIASLFFYAWGEPVYVFVMILSIVINYFCVVLLIPIIFTACYFSDISSESPPLEWTKKAYQFFLFFSLSPMLIASLIAKNNSIEGKD